MSYDIVWETFHIAPPSIVCQTLHTKHLGRERRWLSTWMWTTKQPLSWHTGGSGWEGVYACVGGWVREMTCHTRLCCTHSSQNLATIIIVQYNFQQFISREAEKKFQAVGLILTTHSLIPFDRQIRVTVYACLRSYAGFPVLTFLSNVPPSPPPPLQHGSAYGKIC